MSDFFIKEKTKEDFDKAYFEATIGRIFNKFQGKSNSLLSFQEIMQYVKTKNESYKGMQFVSIDDIVGSEGRYNDFSKEFLPRRKNLRTRWERVDEAHYKDIILPPIQLYQLGQVYFVRDGNHRVSVAKMQGKEFIDAEVTEIQTNIDITQEMTKETLFGILIKHEKKNFMEMTSLDKHRDISMLNFSSPGRFDIILSHINGHQYFLGIDKNISILFETAMLSWYDNVFIPIINEIKDENIIKYFPERTEADLYVWIVKHWDELKNRDGQEIKISEAVKSYKDSYGKGPVDIFLRWIFGIFKK